VPAVNGPVWVAGFPLPDRIPPSAPQNLTASPGDGLVTLVWSANQETDLAGYNVYRSTNSPVPIAGTPLNGLTVVPSTTFTDHTAANGMPYYYAITAVDTSQQFFDCINEANATPSLDAGAALGFNGSNQYVTLVRAGAGIRLCFVHCRNLVPANRRQGWHNHRNRRRPRHHTAGLKGRAEADGYNVDMNYIIGIQASTSVPAPV